MVFHQVDAGRETTDDEGLTARNPKRQRLNDTAFKDGSAKPAFSHNDYTIGWVCALPKEMAAATAMLDCKHGALSGAETDKNTYTLGSIGAHNIVVACLPSGHYGNNNAATVASNMRRTFPGLRFCLMVGIGGGAPGRVDIRLGDVVVSQGVLQYDLGKTVNEGRFARTGSINRPPQELLTAVAKLQADHDLAASRIPLILAEMLERYPTMVQYAYTNSLQDRLFDSTYDHVPSGAAWMDNCESCDVSKLVRRPPRGSFNPKIHYGIIASGNQVMKHGKSRDELAHQLDALCFEMEGAGMMDGFPGVVIRGICDYSDSHKNKQWQEVAAAVAAAYTKELLSVIPSNGPKLTPIRPVASTDLNTNLQELLDCLKFDQIDDRQANIAAKYSTTCQWLLTHPKYLHWLGPQTASEHNAFLWIRGGPGTGKSTLMNFACKESTKDAQRMTIAFFFNARGEILERSIYGMYRSLLYQLLRRVPELLGVFEEREHQQSLHQLQTASRGPEASPGQLEALQDMLRGVLKRQASTPLAIFVDALDECPVNQVEELIEYFEEVCKAAVLHGAPLTICFSSRYYPQIDIQYSHTIDLEEQEGHEKDIALFIRNKLKVGTGKAAVKVKAEVQAKAKGIFMWVVLVVDILKAEYRNGRIFDVKKRLAALPAKLSELFKEILGRDQINLGDLRLCIQWILFAKRPLTPEEYYFAVVSGLSPDALTESDPEEITAVEMGRFIVSSSKGLAGVTKGKKPTVQFIHESVREFWLKDGLKELWPALAATEFESQSHSKLQQCCNSYFKFSTASMDRELYFPKPLPKGTSDEAKRLRASVLTKYPFLDYATRFILIHSNAAASSDSQKQFLVSFDVDFWVLLFGFFEKFEFRRPGFGFDANLLYILASQNLARLIKETSGLDRRTDINCVSYGNSMFVAILKDHQDAVKALLEIETSHAIDETTVPSGRGPELGDFDGSTALSFAASTGREALVSLFLERGSCIEAKDRRGKTPLMHATINRHPGIVKLLLNNGAHQLETCNYGMTALDYAVESANEEAVLLLLEKECTTITGLKGYRLLSQAVSNNYENVLRLLLEHGTDVNTPFGDLLHEAAKKGHESIAQLLLENGANVAANDLLDGTPLYEADRNGHEGIVRLLLENGAYDAMINKDANAAFSYAFHRELYITARLLLEKGADVDHAIDGGTLLHKAARDGHEANVKALIGFGANLATTDGNGKTALFSAIEGEHEGIIRLLLKAGADANAAAGDGDTPIALARRLKILHFLW